MFEGFLNWMDGCQLDEQGFKLQSRLYFCHDLLMLLKITNAILLQCPLHLETHETSILLS